MEEKITFPRTGIYTPLLKELIEELGGEVMLPPPITQNTIKLGVKNSSGFMCFPFKVTLGNLIETLEIAKKENIRLTNLGVGYSNLDKGACRFHHYFEIQKRILNDLGYDLDMILIERKNIFKLFKRINPKNSYLNVIRIFWKYYKKVEQLEKNYYTFNWADTKKVRMGIVGEWYTAIVEEINYNMFNRLKKLNVNVHQSSCATLSGFLRHQIHREDIPKKYVEMGKKYYKEKLPAHASYSLWNMFFYKDMGFDGVIHLMPLSCLNEDSQIITESYIPKKIKNIEIGDKVLTHKGRFRKVTNIFRRSYDDKLLYIDCGGIINLRITPEHPVLSLKRKNILCKKADLSVCRPYKIKKEYCPCFKCRKKYRMNFNPNFVDARDLKKADFIAIPKSNEIIEKDFFKSDMINTKIPKYKDITRFYYNKGILRLLGYYLAEGTVNYDRHKTKNKKYISGVTFTLNQNEKSIIKDIKNIINKNFEASINGYTHPHRTNTVDLHIYNRSFGYIVEKLCGKYCDKKELHSDLMQLEPKLQLEIVKGFFRGDGCIRDVYGETTYRGVTTSFKLANQLFWILIRNDIKPSFKQQNIKNRKVSFMLSLNSKSIKKLNDHTLKIKNRMDNCHYIETDKYFLVPIRKITKKDFEGEIYNLEVKEDNSYVTNNLAVHNCMPESTIEMLMDLVSKKLDLPVYHFPIDEEIFQTGTDMRIKSIIRIIERNKMKYSI